MKKGKFGLVGNDITTNVAVVAEAVGHPCRSHISLTVKKMKMNTDTTFERSTVATAFNAQKDRHNNISSVPLGFRGKMEKIDN